MPLPKIKWKPLYKPNPHWRWWRFWEPKNIVDPYSVADLFLKPLVGSETIVWRESEDDR